MANVKISALTTLSSLGDTDVFPVVNSGVTKQISALNIKNYIGTYGNTQVAAYLVANPQPGTYSNTQVAAYLTNQNIAAQIQSDWNQATVGNVAYIKNKPDLTVYATKTSLQTLDANVGAYQSWANVNLGGGGSTYSNSNVASYLPTYSGNVLMSNIIQTATGQITTPAGSNGNITMNPDGTGYVVFTNITPVIMGNTLQVRDVRDTVYTITGATSGTITIDPTAGDLQVLNLSGSITLNAFTNPIAGQTVTVAVVQPNGTGPYTLTSTMKFAGGNKTLSTAANATDLLTITYVNSTIGYLASLVTGFA